MVNRVQEPVSERVSQSASPEWAQCHVWSTAFASGIRRLVQALRNPKGVMSIRVKMLLQRAVSTVVLSAFCLSLVQLLSACGGGSSIPVSSIALSISSANVMFGNQVVGTTSPSQPITLTNVGTETVTIASVVLGGANASDFTLVNTCGASLAPRASCTANFAFTPSGLGTRDASVTVTDNAPGSPQAVALTGVGTNPVPSITSLSPSTASVGSAAQPLTINGSNFLATSTVTYGRAAHAATFVNGNQLSIYLSQTDQATGGNFPVIITNPSPGGGSSAPMTFTVDQAPAITTANNSTFTYGSLGSFMVMVAGFPTPSLTETGALPSGVNFNTTTGVLSGTAKSSGVFPITLTAHNGAGPDAVQNFTLTVGKATLTITANNAMSTYGQMPGQFTASYTGFVNGDTSAVVNGSPSLTTTATAASPAGNYAITAAAGTLTATNYAFSFVNGTLTVGKAVVTVTANNAMSTYGQMPGLFTASYSGFVNGDTQSVLSGAPNLTTPATSASPVGNYPIKVAQGTLAATNYTFAGFTSGTLTVGKATLTVTANNAMSTYGQTPGPFTASYTGFVNGDTSAVLTGSPSLTTTATAISSAGNYAVTAAVGTLAATNYSFTFVSGTLTVGKAMLTVTANNAMSTYGQTPGPFTASYTGFVNGDTSAVLTGSPSLTTTVTAASPAGNYLITAALGTLSATNYAFGFVNGTLTVNNPIPSITGFSPSSVSAGSLSQTLTISGLNFISGATLTFNGLSHAVTFLNSATLTIQLTAEDQMLAGSFPVVVTNPSPSLGPSLPTYFQITTGSPEVTVSTNALNFGNQLFQTNSKQSQFTLTNTGTTTLHITSIGVSGTNQGDFGQTNDCGTSVSAGNMCTIKVSFTPSMVGVASASLGVSDDAAGSPQTVTLSGTGVNVSVNWTAAKQVIDGFGGAAVDFVSPLTSSLADFFFSPTLGIGLSIVRIQVIPDNATCTNQFCSGNPACMCLASTGATVVTGELQTAQQAKARGVTTFFATSWSPPGSMKTSPGVWNTGSSFVGNDANYTSLASILTSYVSLLNANGVPLYALSPQNEPDINQTYQSCLWTAQQFHDFVPYLYSNLQSAGFRNLKIMVPENAAWSGVYGGFADKTMMDPAVAPEVGLLAQHGYAGDNNIVAPTDYYRHLWQTEDSSQSSVYDGSMSDALIWAARIHNYLTVANVNAFVWWFLSDMPGNGEGTDNAALTDFNGNIAMRAYITGNWSKFVRPGWRRVDLVNLASPLVSAFLSPDGTQSAIVVVNSGSTAAIEYFDVGTQVGSSIVPWITSATQSLVQLPAVSVTNGLLSYTIPANSVVTFVGSASN